MMRRILIAYCITLIASWLLMSWRDSPAPSGKNWRSLTLSGENEILRYRVFPGTESALPALILVHGCPMASACFDPLLKSLPKNRTIIVPDLPGFGGSSREFSDLSFPAQSAALAKILTKEKIQKAHWLAYSQGGGSVLHFAAKQPEAFLSLTLLSSIGVQEHELTGDYFLNHILHGAQWIALESMRWALPHFGILDDSLLNTRYAKHFYQSDLRPLRSHLEALLAPTLILHGKNDGLVTPASAREHHRIVPQSELAWFNGGHMILMSKPHLVSASIHHFLNKVDSGAAIARHQASGTRLQAAAMPADPITMRLQGTTLWLTLFAIALATLASEDLACIAAGLLVARGLIPLPHGIAAAFGGIWLGDMALYAVGRLGGKHLITRRPLRWLISEKSISRARDFLIQKGGIAILISRFTPGLRLPLYVVSGVVKMPVKRVATWFFLAGILWSIPVVSLTAKLGQNATQWLLDHSAAIFPISIALLLVTYLFLKTGSQLMTHQGRRILLSKWHRTLRWEFWPPYIFYPPLACMVIWLALRRGRFLACTAVNPAIPHSGITGESKSMILDKLLPSGAVIPYFKLPNTSTTQKIAAAKEWHIGFPLVIKPDVGERGKDVVIVKNEDELIAEIESRPDTTLIQQYAEGAEFGVFYIRHPKQELGKIFSITIKQLTSVKGDGTSTLEELILNDDRAFLSEKHFRNIYFDKLSWIPKNDEHIPLAKLGSHCRGALFLNGSHLITPQLEAEIHRIASTFSGFYFGRFDLRCPSEEALMKGEGIRIIELNGLGSEATHIYHPHTPLLSAYRTLCSQWRHAIEIGNANAEYGAYVSKWSEIIGMLRTHFFP